MNKIRLNKVYIHINKYLDKYLFVVLIIICLISTIIFYNNNTILAFGDATSRLNISRKIIDNLHPGIAQLGNVWSPLPQLLMLPFVSNTFLWHSGIAGSIMSGMAFILMIIFIYKCIYLITSNKVAALLSALFLLTNVNLLYMQSVAMSEILFAATIAGSVYFLIKWAKQDNDLDLIFGAVFISLCTLTRYEGYFLALFAILLVPLIIYIKTKSRKTAEGKGILFGTLAITGMAAWSIYLWVIFGDPLYFQKIYSGSVSIISTDSIIHKTVVDQGTTIPQQSHLWLSIKSYWTSAAFMNGIIITILATLIFIILIIYLIRKQRIKDYTYLLVMLLPFAVFVFITFTLFRGNIPLFQPDLTFKALADKNTSLGNEYNIRYGLSMAPFIALLIGWFASKRKWTMFIVFGAILLQVFLTFFTQYFVIYQLPIKVQGAQSGMSTDELNSEEWLKSNYDNGLIMISALKHDPVMFSLGLDYKTYIHEGAGKYWLISRDSPEQYAKWIYMYKPSANTSNDSDSVTKYVANNPILSTQYIKVYENKSIYIYKIKGQTLKQLNN